MYTMNSPLGPLSESLFYVEIFTGPEVSVEPDVTVMSVCSVVVYCWSRDYIDEGKYDHQCVI